MRMHTDEAWEDEPTDPSWASPTVDGAWLRTANPNSADGELQNLAAFGSGLARLTGTRRKAARFVVWLILIGIALTIIVSVVRVW